MGTLLGWLEAAATRRPATVIAILAALTAGFAALASTLELQVDLTRFGREDSEAVQAMERVRGEFDDPTAAVQLVVDAEPEGNVLTVAGLAAIEAAEDVAARALGEDARRGSDGRPQLVSVRGGLAAALARGEPDPATPDDARVQAVAGRALRANPELAALMSDDLDIATGSARATVLVVPLDEALTEAERTDAGLRVRKAFDAATTPALAGFRVTAFSSGLFTAGLLDAVRAEAPPLFGLALLVVLAILALAYRSLYDVAVGLAGLLATVAWTFGLVALLGPGFLGWTGPPSQLAVVVPVLLVGLGIDYSVHLTARYREQRAAGQPPAAAAGRALRTVGGALVLATAATATGFAMTATAPLGMVADFGVFVAAGVVCAFTIMALLVPAARLLRDRRVAARARGRRRVAAGDRGQAPVRELGLGRLLRPPLALARRAPGGALAVATVLTGASLLAAASLETEFDRDDFVPEGSEVEAVLAYQSELFGAGLTEATFVVIDGDVTDPPVAGAVEEARERLAGVEGVRVLAGEPQARSMRAPDGGAALVQIRTTAGDAGAERLHGDVREAFAPVEGAGADVTVTSEPIVIAEMSRDLGRFQASAVATTLAIVLVLLTAYYGLSGRGPGAAVRGRWLLGAIAMVPAAMAASLVLGTMWLLGISFNAVTATLTAIAVGIGVPYGVHVVNRFAEDLDANGTGEAVAATLRRTGGALATSALTTLGAFVVLSFSNLPPIRSLGLLGGAGIAFALLAALLVEPGALVLWAGRSRPRERGAGPRHVLLGGRAR